MSRVVHVSTRPRYVVECGTIWKRGEGHWEQTWTEWEEHSAHADRRQAIAEADQLAADHPSAAYRVVDTWEDE